MVETSETTSLISAGKVQGTNVYNTQGDLLGEVYDVMIDKMSGKVAYAVVSFGGFLGMGNRYHPLPWSTLKYDLRQGGYVVGLTKRSSKERRLTRPTSCRHGATAPTRRPFTTTTRHSPTGARSSTTLADLLTPLFAANPFSAVRASLRWWSSDEFEDGLAHGGQGRLRRRPVDSFFPALLF